MRWRNGGGGFDGVEKEVWRFLFFWFWKGGVERMGNVLLIARSIASLLL